MRSTSALLATVAVAGLLTAAPAGAGTASEHCGANETYKVRNFHVTMKSRKKAYRIGEDALLDIKVTRPAHEDPADQGIRYEPPISTPAEGATVSIGVQVRDVLLYGYAITGEDGKAVGRVKLYPWTRPGTAFGAATARKEVIEGGIANCFFVQEFGTAFCPRCFKVRD